LVEVVSNIGLWYEQTPSSTMDLIIKPPSTRSSYNINMSSLLDTKFAPVLKFIQVGRNLIDSISTKWSFSKKEEKKLLCGYFLRWDPDTSQR